MSAPAIGIDLGTTYSAVATVDNGRPVLIPNRDALLLTPSVVGFTANGERVVGERARLLAETLPDHVAVATKRFIGRRWTADLAQQARTVVPYPLLQGNNGEIRLRIGGRVLPLTQIAAMILGELKLDAETHFAKPVTEAVITVPANFDDGQRAATKEAARIAGLHVLRVINEPTAAAVAYGLGQAFEGRALVFDLGGGTFDVSILEVKNGVFEVRATGGDPYLGGEDFDQRIVQWLLAQVPDDMRDLVSKDTVSMQRLRVAAERAKRELSRTHEAYISVSELGDHANGGKRLVQVDTALTRAFFETMSEPLSRRCLSVCQQVMAEANMDPKSMDAVLLVGGMTRVPLVRWLVADFFGKAPASNLNPDEAVALGAAVQAAELANQTQQALLLDVVSQPLGVGVLGGSVRRLISKNTPVPARAAEIFHPSQVGQTAARIRIFQGEDADAEGCMPLGEVLLNGLHVNERADVPLEVSFEISAEGLLSVRATDLSSGVSKSLQVEARTDLAASEVERLAREQQSYANGQQETRMEQAVETFQKLLERGDKLLKFLETSAKEAPSNEAEAAVAQMQSLLASGREAMETQERTQMADVARRLVALVRL
jgi:molecular chaperone DnaK